LSKGPRELRGLARPFRVIGTYNGSRKLDKQEFYFGLKDYGVTITKREAEVLLDVLDTDEDGTINFDQFLLNIRGKPNDLRISWIVKAYNKLDKDGNGYVTSFDIRQHFDCSQHPRIISGEVCFDEVFTEFLQCFGDKNKDGSITQAQWNDYYAAVSASIDNDDHFVQLMRTAWKL
jgi:Ca2+-binding EF-hand superfamily protein